LSGAEPVNRVLWPCGVLPIKDPFPGQCGMATVSGALTVNPQPPRSDH